MNFGLYGGTFNPFHNGHLGIIQHVRHAFELDRIFLIPSATPPHKPGTNLASAAHRFQMVKESLKDYNHLLASDKELQRDGPSFTIDTIHEFKKEYGPDTRFYLLMGSDAFLDITTWERKNQIFSTIEIIIMLRGNWRSLDPIISFIDENISKGYTFDRSRSRFTHKNRHDIHICKVPVINISSSLVRERISRSKPITDLVPAPVEAIIRTKELYR